MEEHDLERLARKRVGMKLGWAIHAVVYVLVNLGLLVLNAASGSYHWSVWPLAGWGLGLAIHGAVVAFALRGEGIRRRMLDDEIAALKKRGY
jgi:hypothetical protein